MTRLLLVICLCAVFLFGVIACYSHDFLHSQDDKGYGGDAIAPARRMLMSDATNGPDTALMASLDGTIYLFEVGSMTPVWSFSSGTQIYSSYQAPIDTKENSSGIEIDYFIDCGDDWELYAHSSLGKLKLMKSLEEYIASTPQIAENGGVVLGSRKTTTFLVDARTGKVIHTYSMPDSPSVLPGNGVKNFLFNTNTEELYKKDEMSLYITRTDYTLTSFASNSDTVLWNLTVAEIGAAFLCHDAVESFNFEPGNMGSSVPDLPYNMPLPCQSRALVYRFRTHNTLEALSLLNRPIEAFRKERMLPASKGDTLPAQPHAEKVVNLLTLPGNRGEYLDAPESMDTGGVFHNFNKTSNEDDAAVNMKILSGGESRVTNQKNFGSSHLILLFTILLGLVIYHYKVVSGIRTKLALKSTVVNPTSTPSKKKRSRKAGKSGNNGESPQMQTIQNVTDGNSWLNLNCLPSSSGGRSIGKLVVSEKEIAKGSNGTMILEGAHEGRLVAVKRLVRACNDIAAKEIQNLILSDRHPNIVRWYGVEQDQDFVYLALERCTCSLNDLVVLKSSITPTTGKVDSEFSAEYKTRLEFMNGFMQDFELWNQDGCPLPLLFKLMRDVICGVEHLHELGIIHRDLKPQNVLITNERDLCAKISDMGISKRLIGDVTSLTCHATGCGTSGWQAPEQLLRERQTRAVDLFSLGCLLFFCITRGKHPFGNDLERDINISRNKFDLFLVEHIPEAVDIISRLLDPSADKRPSSSEVRRHPLFWNAETRLAFLRDCSDMVELEDREAGSDLLKSLESIGPIAMGGKWNDKMESAFLGDISRYRKYKFDSVRDLLRVMRNKINHYRELPVEIQETIGGLPEGFDQYFRNRFPKLLIQVYKVMFTYCNEEQHFFKYFQGSGS